MAYGDDITEGIPYVLSNPLSTISYSSTSEAYDLAINGYPFFMTTSDETPYRRQTAQYRKEQFDTSKEPGEQSITGWWVRAQSSFHSGSGIKFYDPAVGESVDYRFADSQGVNIWEKGKATLLKDVTQGHEMTTPLAADDRTQQHVRTIRYNGTDAVLMHDGLDVDKIDGDGNVIHFLDYNAGTSEPVYSICDDGVNAYWITNVTEGGALKLHMYKKPLAGDATTGVSYPAVTGDVTLMFKATGVLIENAVLEFVKDRIVACINNAVYEIAPNATALPTAIYTNPNTNYKYHSVTASGPAIYACGYSGIYSTIQKFTLTSNGQMPVLTQASVAAEFPPGEIVHKIYYYLNHMMIGTNKGVRVADVNDQDGSIMYGPLIVETTQPCYDFAARDRFVWCATGINGTPGLIRIDLSTVIEGEELRYAWANDLQQLNITDKSTTGVAFLGTSSRLTFCTNYNNGNGYIYIEHPTRYVASGYIKTGKIRYGTLENKVFKTLKARVDNTYGNLEIQSIDTNNGEYTIASFSEGDFTPEVNVSYPIGAQEFMSFKFTIFRYTADVTKTPVFSGYQLKALPAIPRQRLIQYPLACYDHETDALGVQVGHEGSSYEKLISLEELENLGDTVRVEDFRNEESYLGVIEEMQFLNRTPTDKRFSGFGGILLVTIRTI